MILRTSIVSYLSFCVSANFGALFSIEKEESFKEPKAYVFKLITISVIAFSYWFAKYVDPIDLQVASFKASWGTMYQNLDVKRENAMLNTFVFFIRRLAIVMALTEQVFPIKYGLITFIQLAQISYYFNVSPFAD